MAKLSTKKRRSLPKSSFAIPSKRLYPINDRGHAKAALREASRPSTRGAYSTVRRAVCARYPSMGACSNGGAKGTGKSRSAKGKR